MASRSLNRAIIIGNLTRDPELKYTPSGAPVCTFGVATNRSWVTAEGQTKEETQYHRIVAWHKLAELCGKLLSKGRKIFAEGRLSYRTFTGKDGLQKTVTEIILDDFIVFGDGKRTIVPEEEVQAVASGTENEKEEETEEKDESEKEDKDKEKSEDETVNPDDIPF